MMYGAINLGLLSALVKCCTCRHWQTQHFTRL